MLKKRRSCQNKLKNFNRAHLSDTTETNNRRSTRNPDHFSVLFNSIDFSRFPCCYWRQVFEILVTTSSSDHGLVIVASHLRLYHHFISRILLFFSKVQLLERPRNSWTKVLLPFGNHNSVCREEHVGSRRLPCQGVWYSRWTLWCLSTCSSHIWSRSSQGMSHLKVLIIPGRQPVCLWGSIRGKSYFQERRRLAETSRSNQPSLFYFETSTSLRNSRRMRS